MIGTIIKEMGWSWLFNRGLYSTKLVILRKFPIFEQVFEHKVNIRRWNLCQDMTSEIEEFIKTLPQKEIQSLLDTADLACEGTVIGFSSTQMSYGMPINWQLNPISGKACDNTSKWYCIPDFDKDRGDIKAVWEISRFSHFITLARAYLVSENKKYYDAFSRQLAAWLKENPYSFGANFKCGQECALRMMNAILAYNVFYTKGLTNKDDEQNLLELIRRCYKKILSNFFYAHKCIKNNHTISELVGMIIGAWCSFDEKRLKKAYKMLDTVIDDQFSEDGGYTQYSFNYQRLVLQVLEYALFISDKTEISLSEHSLEKIKNSVLLLYQCQDQSGDVPNYGFNDGALVFPVSASEYRDFRPVLGALYSRLFGKRLYSAGEYDEEAIWFGILPNTLSNADEPRIAMAFSEAGLFTLREKHFWLMCVLNDYKKRPAHMDQLHIDLWVDGVNALCDCGTYSYADPVGEALALTEAHNTAKIENIEQMTKNGAFLVYDRTKRLAHNLSKDFFSGKMQSKQGYIHERRIETRKNGIDIYDVLTAKAERRFDLIMHTPCEIKSLGRQIKLFHDNKHILTIEGNLDIELKEGIRSVYYLTKEPLSTIYFKGVAKDGKAQSHIKIDILMNEEAIEDAAL